MCAYDWVGQDNLKLILPIGHTDEILDFVYSSELTSYTEKYIK